jgi:hypothetical protein
MVLSVKWREGPIQEQYPSESFLIIELEVRKVGQKPRVIPSFCLVDNQGAEYAKYERSWYLDGTIGSLESLNPNMKKHGFLVFDVPRSEGFKGYKLKVSSDLVFGDYALIKLTLPPNQEN